MPMGTLKKLSYGILSSILIIFLCFLLGEAAVFALFHKQIALFPRYVTGIRYNDFSIRGNIPYARYRHKSYDGEWAFQINGQGFRSNKDYTYEKKKDTLRILVLGDSFTIGYEVSEGQTYAAILERTLKEAGIEAEVINAGVSGFSNAEELVFLEQEGLRYQPDIVILGFFVNDFSDNVRADLYRLQEGKLTLQNKSYLPAIKIRDFFHSFFIYRWLSGHSYFFNYLNNAFTVFIKNKWEEQNLANLEKRENKEQLMHDEDSDYREALAYEILKRIYQISKENDIYFILLDIPLPDLQPSIPPSLSTTAVCDYFLNPVKLLEAQKTKGALYRSYGRSHWTEISHEAVGKELAKIVLEKGVGNP